ncbi:hypothetical protein JAAARDRAFT_36210 [Jaapia argillacea MUCL 33604]|uniref:Uncharacterized protein n=1 Tax=Jaapia argillacea MUCL 33604 TaxID=933084 RepID=A0A067Q296_9AGAM|nr:hypothetical protein JAAARDRAFT_36210 [Jaapia argillacea MUCL 33604]
MSRFLRRTTEMRMPSNTLFCMRAEVSRRLFKLGITECPQFVVHEVRNVGQSVENLLQDRWHVIREKQSKPRSSWNPEGLDVFADTRLSLSDSKAYLSQVLRCNSAPRRKYLAPPRQSPTPRHRSATFCGASGGPWAPPARLRNFRFQ